MSKPEHTVFFAWQSDSPASLNRNAIRTALTAAAAAIEATTPGLILKIDEATRGMVGAENVPRSIQEKIEAADIFVGDVTTITPPIESGVGERPCPNPNVVFEAGYAAAHLGWKRMILLTNLSIANYSDLPFDFDRQRVSGYRVQSGASKEIAKLTDLLIAAVSTIVEADPPRPAELRSADPASVRRGRDVAALRRTLCTFPITRLEDLIHRLPRMIED